MVRLIASTARWVHPDAFRAMPVWYPEHARGRTSYKADWASVYTNTSRQTGQTQDKVEANIQARKALLGALGLRNGMPKHWTVCHIWGVDDPGFQAPNTVITDPRFYSCTANMVLLPTPLKAFSDSVPEVKTMLRVCAFHLYGWVCQHPHVEEQACQVASRQLPEGYPHDWPGPDRAVLPPGTAPFSIEVKRAIARRKASLRASLESPGANYPAVEVRQTLVYWNIEL
ncbi:hypothetical protein [Azospirillum sp. B4]|uniref:hypothetical protein n=1 Tax=Azospirillum sp. B4 TaxID=95605 RepID=UPI002078D3CF|nr:hypothetical protein [Azospirillum sp. B4]